MLCGNRLVALLGDHFGDRGAGFVVAGIIHITVHARQRRFGDLFQFLV